tara:strand:- start:3203 stop:3496 length:294 start_codon:yes stop_codon:yes gene_type:complete
MDKVEINMEMFFKNGDLTSVDHDSFSKIDGPTEDKIIDTIFRIISSEKDKTNKLFIQSVANVKVNNVFFKSYFFFQDFTEKEDVIRTVSVCDWVTYH